MKTRRSRSRALELCATLASILGAVGPHGAAASPVPDSTTTIFLVRHAERSTTFQGTDAPLSDAGLRRARDLARTFKDAGISAIYSTAPLRNRQTAQPLADSLRDSVRIADQKDAAALAMRIQAEHMGQRVLIVGHSDTVPQLVEALSGQKVPPWVSGEFDLVYVVSLCPGRPASVYRLRYGESSAPP